VLGASPAVSFAVLPGDVTRDGVLDAVDRREALSPRHWSRAGGASYNPLRDLNGDAVVNAFDAVLARNFSDGSLPPGPSPAPTGSETPIVATSEEILTARRIVRANPTDAVRDEARPLRATRVTRPARHRLNESAADAVFGRAD
jgi:hypothetical protein